VTIKIPGVLLAGGLARRMGGGDKPMRAIGGCTILERVITRLTPQCDGLILSRIFQGRWRVFWRRWTGPRQIVLRCRWC